MRNQEPEEFDAATSSPSGDNQTTADPGAGKRLNKVLKLQILKPVGDLAWDALAKQLRDTRYRVFRLANLAVSEAYLNFVVWKRGQSAEFTTSKIAKLNRDLRGMLAEEGVTAEELDRFSSTGALPDTVVGALSQYKIRGLTSKAKWSDVVRGKSALPTFRSDMAIPIRCDKPGYRRLEKTKDGEIELDLMIGRQPYPRVRIATAKIGFGAEAILKRLIENAAQSLDGYRQRCLEIKYAEKEHQWNLFVTYDFPAPSTTSSQSIVVVGVDLGFSCPLYAAISNGHARLGRRQFGALIARIRSLQTQVMARRRSMLSGGKKGISDSTARDGHGRRRKLRSVDSLEGRIHSAYTTLNHQLSAAVVRFARQHGAATIQIEDLEGLKEHLTGTFLGERWRYHQLQQFLTYKAKEAGMELRSVSPQYTSRRCSACGHIHLQFSRGYRDANKAAGFVARFKCPACEFEADPDYNAARNLCVLDIEQQIRDQLQRQERNPAVLSQTE